MCRKCMSIYVCVLVSSLSWVLNFFFLLCWKVGNVFCMLPLLSRSTIQRTFACVSLSLSLTLCSSHLHTAAWPWSGHNNNGNGKGNGNGNGNCCSSSSCLASLTACVLVCVCVCVWASVCLTCVSDTLGNFVAAWQPTASNDFCCCCFCLLLLLLFVNCLKFAFFVRCNWSSFLASIARST